MAGNKEVNSNLEIKGKINLKDVPNNTPTGFLVWNSGIKDIAQRTPAQIISDLGLITATNIAASYYTNTQVDTNIKTAVDNIQIGGRNLAIKSNTDIDILPLYGVSANYSIQDDITNSSKKIFRATNIVRQEGDLVFFIPFLNSPQKFSQNLNGVPLTISFYIRTNNSQFLNVVNETIDSNWKKVSFQYTWTSGNLHFFLSGADLQWFEIHSLKIEKGNKATDWTPAPEDQVSDWNTTDVNDFSFLKNKPTKLSQFTNDSNFLTQETDPTVPAHVKSISTGNIAEWNSAFKNRNLFNNVSQLNDINLPAGNYKIDDANIPGLPNLYTSIINTGQYSGGGYSQQLGIPFQNGTHLGLWLRTSAGPDWNPWYKMWDSSDFSQAHINNWQAAFGWGNHSGLYLPLSGGTMTGDVTFRDDNEGIVLNDGARVYKKLGSGLTFRRNVAEIDPRVENSTATQSWKIWHEGNDGAGSGLDADLLDGLEQTQFLRADSVSTGDVKNGNFAIGTDVASNFIQSHNGKPLNLNPLGNAVTINGGNVWHSNNDGAGSGLDADLIDGIDSTRIIYGDNSSGTINGADGTPADWMPVKSGFYRPNSKNSYGALAIWAAHPQAVGGQYGAGITFSYGGTEAWLTGRDGNNTNTGQRRIWTSSDFTNSKIAEWNAAYSWGNHAGLYSSVTHNHDTSYLPMSYTDVDMDANFGDKNLLLGRNISGWASGTKPSGSHNGFGILHVTTHVGGYATQFGFDSNQNKMWVRSRNPDTWTAWEQLWHSGNFTPSNYFKKDTESSGKLMFSNDEGGIYGTIGVSDAYRIWGRSNSSNQGYLEISTADDGTEPIIVSQYIGPFTNKVREAKLLDESGNTSFPGRVSAPEFYTSSIFGTGGLNVLTPEGSARTVKSGGLLASSSYADEPPTTGIMSRGLNYFHNQQGGQPYISVAIGDTDTGFNWEGDGSISYYSNGSRKYYLNDLVPSKYTSYLQSNRNFPDGTLIYTNIDYSQTSGDSWLLEIKGNSYNGITPIDVKVQGYIYADTIINTGGFSNVSFFTTIKAMNIGGKLCFWFGSHGYWLGYDVFCSKTMGYGSLNEVTSIVNSGVPGGTKVVDISLGQVAHQDWSNSKFAEKWENALAVGFSSGLIPNSSGSQYPYIYHSSGGGYIPLATQEWVSTNYIRTSHPVYNITQANINSWNTPQTLSVGQSTTNTQINISSGNSISFEHRFLGSFDGSRNPTDIHPNTSPKSIRADFAAAHTVGGTGNYAGVLTYAPWDGTTASTGDSSYQLAFINETGINGSGNPGLRLRKGIDTTWGSWISILTSANGVSKSGSNVVSANNWNVTNGDANIGFDTGGNPYMSWGGISFTLADDGFANLFNANLEVFNGYVASNSFVKYGGTASQVLMANGTVKELSTIGSNYTAGSNISIAGNAISVVSSPTFSGAVTAPAFYESSLKSLKKNIKTFEKSGLALVNQLDIVTFDRIDETAKNKIGIIADDSPKEFLSEELDAVDLYKTVFIQAKAIQELTDKNQELEKRLEKLEKLIRNAN